jgi:hypothetical protein
MEKRGSIATGQYAFLAAIPRGCRRGGDILYVSSPAYRFKRVRVHAAPVALRFGLHRS